MAPALLSRFSMQAAGEPSIYETFRQQDESSDQSDLEERAGMAVDEENLGSTFRDHELDQALADTVPSLTSASGAESSNRRLRLPLGNSQTRGRRQFSGEAAVIEEADDEVPSSLLFEGTREPNLHKDGQKLGDPPPVQAKRPRADRAKWKATREQQQLFQESAQQPTQGRTTSRRAPLSATTDAREQALWRWANVQNLDNFLKDVYAYFLGNGIWSIILSRGLNLLTFAFVASFSTFLLSCIQYSKISSSKTLDEVRVPQCTKNMSGLKNLLIWLFVFLWMCRAFQYIIDIPRLQHMHNFFRYLLQISDSEIQTVSWQEVVKRLMSLRDLNPATAAGVSERHRRFMGSQSKQRMDAHDIANRLMRRDNYLISLINKDILDLTLPWPFINGRQLFSRTMEWNLSFCILDYVFDDQGQVRPHFLKDTHRRVLSDALRRRFIIVGVMNFLLAPFIFTYFFLLYFLRYFNEYQRNPSQIGSRQYTPFAEWKFREFNELWHLFQRRIKMSYPFATHYIDQFPKDKTIQVMAFVSFVSGALLSVLAFATVIDSELSLGFEITPGWTVLFYLTVLGTVWTIARGGVPEEHLVFDPEYALEKLTDFTHYMPSHWQGRLGSDEVQSEFALLYKMKVVIFLEEMLSILLTPFVLWISLPRCSDRLIDFFREFTVHVDGLGYVCSFAVFDFKKGAGNMAAEEGGTGQGLRENYYATKDNKMLASYYGFIGQYVMNQPNGPALPYSPNKHTFQPPPAFPGLMSPSSVADLGYESHGAERQDRSRQNASQMHRAGLAPQPNYRTPRFAPRGGHSSPMASILLDPQHQPTQSVLRAGHKIGTQSRLRQSRKTFLDPVENAETSDSEHGAVDDSRLEESWKTTRAGHVEDDGEEGAQASDTNRGPGVLGLVYQFSRAQTDGRVTGVKI